MGAEITSAERNDLYRLNALSYFNPVSDQPANASAIMIGGAPAVSSKIVNGLHQVTLTMPDGTKEYWAQTNARYCVDTGFKGMAFERRNADFKTPVLDQNNAPQVQVMFPGNTQTRADLRASQLIVHGNFSDPAFNRLMDEYTKDRAQFMADVVQGIQSRRTTGQGNANVSIGGHSIGANAAIGAAHDLQQKGINGARTYLIEPVGAGQRVQYLAGKGLDPDRLDDVITLSDVNSNFSHGAGGTNRFANARIGTPFTIDTGFRDDIMERGHLASSMANALAAGNAITHDHASMISARDIMSKPALPAAAQQEARQAADAMVTMFEPIAAGKTTLTRGFNGTTDLSLNENVTVAQPPRQAAAPSPTPPTPAQPAPATAATPAPSTTTPTAATSAQTPAPPAQAPPPTQSKDPIEVVLDYIESKGCQCNSPAELNRALARCFVEAQLTPEYQTAFARVYPGKQFNGVDFLPGAATREAMEKKGVPASVLAAMDSLNMFDKSQRNDLYEPPSRENRDAVIAQVRETPLLFEQPTELAMAGGGAPGAPGARASR